MLLIVVLLFVFACCYLSCVVAFVYGCLVCVLVVFVWALIGSGCIPCGVFLVWRGGCCSFCDMCVCLFPCCALCFCVCLFVCDIVCLFVSLLFVFVYVLVVVRALLCLFRYVCVPLLLYRFRSCWFCCFFLVGCPLVLRML